MTRETGAPRLADILAAAPFGLAVRSADGVLLHATGPAANGAPPRPGFRVEQFCVACDGRDYEVEITLDASTQMAREEDLIRKVFFDELTGLPNRRLIERSVTAMIERGADAFALAFFDLDGFKNINDYYGHSIGDQLLARFAERLNSMLGPNDMLGRLSGDEFLLLLSPVDCRDELMEAIEQFSARLKEPFIVEGFEIFASASVGVSVYPDDGTSYDMLKINADRAMYAVKGAVKGAVRFFDPSIDHAAAERNHLEQRLRLTIRDHRIVCAYQPKFDFRSGAISGIEVLMRWLDEDGILQGPGKMLTLASEIGLLDGITHDILAETIGAIDSINEAFGRDIPISLNVSAHQASDFDAMQALVNALDRTGFAERFMLELTEDAFLPGTQFQSHILPLIRSVGARVSIDDFGVGFSSLSMLAAITADEVKVDRSFITDIHRRPRNQSILRAVEALGTSLGMSIVVEGVETEEELAYLRDHTGITYGQGYLFSRPILLRTLDGACGTPASRPTAPPRTSEARRA